MGVSLTIDRLWQGESGAAPWQRKHGQVTRSRNVRHDISLGGASKRGPTELIADLDSDSASATFDSTKTYYWTSLRGAIIAIGDQAVFGWDEDGVPLQINDESGSSFMDYINLTADADPNDYIDTASSHDTIIVLNRTKITDVDDAWTNQQAINFIVNGDQNNNSGVPNVASTPTAVDTFDDLPASPSDGDLYRTRNDYQLDPAGVYVYWDGAVHEIAEGYFPEHDNWHRIPKREQSQALYDENKLPHRIVYDEDAGTLTLSTCPWRQRLSGTAKSNAAMPWRSKAIKAVEFHHGRLFLISDRHVTASRRNDFFNLWNDNVNAISDSDRIALDISSSNVGLVLHSGICGASIVIICENAQLSWGSGELALTNINGIDKVVTSYRARDIQPAVTAGYVSFIDEMGDVHQFAASDDSIGVFYSGLLTVHRRTVLDNKTPTRMFHIDGTVFITIDEDDALLNDSFIVQGQVVQSAWGEFGPYEPPVFFDAWAGHIRIITRRADSTAGYSMLSYVHRQVAPPALMTYIPRMDRLELVAPGSMTYDEDTGRTTIPHSGRDGTVASTRLVLRSDDKVHAFLAPIAINESGNPEFKGDWTDTSQYLGFTFDTRLVLSKLYATLTSEEINCQGLAVFHFESSDYTIGCAQLGRDDQEQKWQAAKVGQVTIGQPLLGTGHQRFGFDGDPRNMEITLSSSTPGQCTWMAVEYELQGTAGRSNA